MKVTVIFNPNLPEDEVEFQVREMTPQLDSLIKQMKHLDFKLIGSRLDKKYTLNFSKINRIYASDKKVYAVTDDQLEFVIPKSLTNIEEKLPTNFLRISNSEIINADKIKFFDLTFGGKIKINFTNGQFTYSSRSYLKKIKEYFGL
ncbi:MAG: LytTR family transcriptional regulator [Streptococcaceae bacterium]|jgi:DNA-binding LytR/AlgR family response regulator|nr:LytTR family transcriptional regulator [Streptococcaceae bacterium]